LRNSAFVSAGALSLLPQPAANKPAKSMAARAAAICLENFIVLLDLIG
jgi:hypothetical protein